MLNPRIERVVGLHRRIQEIEAEYRRALTAVADPHKTTYQSPTSPSGWA